WSLTTFNWKNNNFRYDATLDGAAKNIGGLDGIATAFSSTLLMKGYYATLASKGCFAGRTVTTAADANSYGAGFTFQDKGIFSTCASGSYDDSAYSGQEVLWFNDPGSSCKYIQGFAKYTHTWSTTAVTGFSIGVISIGVQTNSTS